MDKYLNGIKYERPDSVVFELEANLKKNEKTTYFLDSEFVERTCVKYKNGEGKTIRFENNRVESKTLN